MTRSRPSRRWLPTRHSGRSKPSPRSPTRSPSVQLEADPRLTARWWDDVDRLFAALPTALARQLKLAEYDLALRYSQTGQFHDVFLGPDHPPALSVATWLLGDLEIPSGAHRDDMERRLFVASVLLAARAQTVAALTDPDGFTTNDRIALVQWL